uniref:NADP-dependent oxidoreductase domain-containing protein n=1 Tax=Moniliophthora roreri TaxID=221103 RepID=A0A0W0FSP2_MONRR
MSFKSFNNYIALSNGVRMPQIGLGTWQSTKLGEGECAIESALKEGYRHIDAALYNYGNQKEVGAGISKSGVPRSEIFLVSKLHCTDSHRPELVEADLDNTLKELDTEYLVFYLIYWPVPFQPGATLSATRSRADDPVALLKSDKVRAIGVSNFTIEHLEILADVTPAVNQIEVHPLLQQGDLTAYSKEKGVHGKTSLVVRPSSLIVLSLLLRQIWALLQPKF